MKIYAAGPHFIEGSRLNLDLLKGYIRSSEILYKNLDLTIDLFLPFENSYNFLDLSDTDLRYETIKTIVKDNVDHLNDSSLIIADLMESKQNKPDTGTIWELGFAYSKRLKLILYDFLNTQSISTPYFYNIPIYSSINSLIGALNNTLVTFNKNVEGDIKQSENETIDDSKIYIFSSNTELITHNDKLRTLLNTRISSNKLNYEFIKSSDYIADLIKGRNKIPKLALIDTTNYDPYSIFIAGYIYGYSLKTNYITYSEYPDANMMIKYTSLDHVHLDRSYENIHAYVGKLPNLLSSTVDSETHFDSYFDNKFELINTLRDQHSLNLQDLKNPRMAIR